MDNRAVPAYTVVDTIGSGESGSLRRLFLRPEAALTGMYPRPKMQVFWAPKQEPTPSIISGCGHRTNQSIFWVLGEVARIFRVSRP